MKLTWFSTQYRRWFGRHAIEDPRPIAAESPYTYYLPSENELLAVAPGDIVQIIFRSIPSGESYDAERMWVVVKEALGEDLCGALDNIPFDMPQLRQGSIVKFRRTDIIDIEWQKNRELAPPPPVQRRSYWERCFVDDFILNGRFKVEYLYREKPDQETLEDQYPDSGWRFRCDSRQLTDKEYESGDCSYIAVGKVLNQDDSWIHLINEPAGSAFLRNWDTGEFEPVERHNDD